MNQTHTKLSHEEHVLQLPDTYIGSVEQNTAVFWCFNKEKNIMEKRELTFIPGEFKIFDEIVVNAYDQFIRTSESEDEKISKVTEIRINVSKETGEITVFNDGEGIPVTVHPIEKIYVPEMIFGELLTSSNYDKDEKKHVGGKNGYGAKLTNIFSTSFNITTVDHREKKKFSMTFYNNKKKKDKPEITTFKKKPFTQVSYTPDFKRFNQSGLSEDMLTLMEKRAYDLAACSNDRLSIYFNDQKINCKSFEKYIDLFLGKEKKAYERVNNRWEVGCALSPSLMFEQVSFVNGINTSLGGKHVEYVINQICRGLCDYIQKKKKITVKPNYIRENLIVFIKSTIDNPSFSSQTKETLTTTKTKFGSTCEIPKSFIDSLAKTGIVDKAILLAEAKQNKKHKQTDGKKKGRITGIPKLEDANWAGTKKSSKCTLILTEGDSAKSTAMAGLQIIGRDQYGVFPLKGKPLNVKDEANMKKVATNEEIGNIKKIMGLETGKKYADTESLRYGKILILTDQDEDGSHIKGLIFTLFETMWPSLYKIDGFLNSMLTPIVKAKNKKETLEFFSLKDFEKFKKENESKVKKCHVKYYKGLATSTPSEAKEYFRNPRMVNYTSTTDADNDALNLAFGKEKESANKRKTWLSEYDRENTLDYKAKDVSISEFISKDLIHFSNSDNVRSIPSAIDGLKPSQRKVLFGCLKRKLTDNEIKVAQLAGYVSEHSAYHHGEASLCGTIVNMAQNFVGSNNINLLDGVGQFGTRIHGGKDAGQPRYIFTKLEKITMKLFNQEDTPLLTHLYDDGMKVEPEYYVPILPMILVNGTSGIGTGWSTDVPCFNPVDIVKNIKLHLAGLEMKEMVPYYKGFKGSIKKIAEGRFQTTGKFMLQGKNMIVVTELPVGLWTQKFKENLEKMISGESKKKHNIRYYNSYSTDTTVCFEITLEDPEKYDIKKMLDLTSTINTTNMVLYDKNFKLKKYNDPREIIADYVEVRRDFYERRIAHNKSIISKELEILQNKLRFIKDFIDDKIKVIRVRKSDIEAQLTEANYYKKDSSFDYLVSMPIYSLTEEKIEELEKKILEKKQELDTLENTTANGLYQTELDELKLKELFAEKKIMKIQKLKLNVSKKKKN